MTDIRATLNKIAPAVEQLARHQQQADADGVMVTVSRQAVDEVVNSINEIAISLSAAPGEPCAPQPAAGWDIEAIAKWLHDETSHPDAYPNHTWPETERDDGQRAGGFVKIVPLHAQEYFRDIARRLVTQLDRPSLRREAPAPAEGVTVELEPWRDELSEIAARLGAAIVQSCAKDDQIIMDHVKAAHEIAKIVRRKA